MNADELLKHLCTDQVSIVWRNEKISQIQLRDMVLEKSSCMRGGEIIAFQPKSDLESLVNMLAILHSENILCIDSAVRSSVLQRKTELFNLGVQIIIPSSGTMDGSKLVLLSLDNVCADAQSAFETLSHPAASLFYSMVPLSHLYGFTCGLIMPIVCHRTILLGEPFDYVSMMKTYKPNLVFVVPSILGALLDDETFETINLSNVLFISGGSKVSEEILRICESRDITVSNGYGLTECGPVVAVNPYLHAINSSVGVPLSCNTIRIEGGEIVVSGPNVAIGKLDYKGISLFRGVFYTGDLGSFEGDYLFVQTRSDLQVALDNGINVNLEDIDAIAESIDGVRIAVTIFDKERLLVQYYSDRGIIADLRYLISNRMPECRDYLDVCPLKSNSIRYVALGKKKRVRYD